MKPLFTAQPPIWCCWLQWFAAESHERRWGTPGPLSPAETYPAVPKRRLPGIGCCPVNRLDTLYLYRLGYFPIFLTQTCKSWELVIPNSGRRVRQVSAGGSFLQNYLLGGGALLLHSRNLNTFSELCVCNLPSPLQFAGYITFAGENIFKAFLTL